ncbi:Rv3654c family TadE-like protein [Streptomyces sp. DH12]|uniref:Rv3654c family TadE-like protein n=1 Tax=Streptomyces sp. DH12 TaxID=2857010 RepID=UPI0027E0FF3B|nr:Rv3654c family TadE-like protein [Streptomyces sp. DH12]
MDDDAPRGGGRPGGGHGGRPDRERAGLTRGRDRGSASVWAALAAGALCVVFAAVLALGQAVTARHRAGGAADLAALAAADRALQGADEACRAAARVARAQRAEVARCDVRGEIAEVTARARFGPYAPEVRSRAGPPEAWPGAPGAGGTWPGSRAAAARSSGPAGARRPVPPPRRPPDLAGPRERPAAVR